jgi:hypothetical protein
MYSEAIENEGGFKLSNSKVKKRSEQWKTTKLSVYFRLFSDSNTPTLIIARLITAWDIKK